MKKTFIILIALFFRFIGYRITDPDQHHSGKWVEIYPGG